MNDSEQAAAAFVARTVWQNNVPDGFDLFCGIAERCIRVAQVAGCGRPRTVYFSTACKPARDMVYYAAGCLEVAGVSVRLSDVLPPEFCSVIGDDRRVLVDLLTFQQVTAVVPPLVTR